MKHLLLILLSIIIFLSCSEENAGQSAGQSTTTSKERAESKKNTEQLQSTFSNGQRNFKTVKDLAKFVTRGASNDYEKAALAYSWIANNISYDDAAFNAGNVKETSAETVLKTRKAVCNGYCNLFNKVCDELGIESVKIVGYQKGFGYQPGTRITKADHAWNAVKLNGDWKLVDATWGAGYGKKVGGRLKTIPKYDPFYFDTDPYEFLFKHLPENKKYQYISNPISKKQFENLPKVKTGLFSLGISAKDILQESKSNSNITLPKAWNLDYDIKIVKAELNSALSSNQHYTFEIECQEEAQIIFNNGGKLTKLDKVGNVHSGTIQPARGNLTISSRRYPREKEFVSILEYQVR